VLPLAAGSLYNRNKTENPLLHLFASYFDKTIKKKKKNNNNNNKVEAKPLLALLKGDTVASFFGE
jgi:hypothetical protein